MMRELDAAGPDEKGCCGGRDGEEPGRRHGESGHCCGGRRRRDDVSLSREEEIAALERQIAASRARLEALRRD